MEGELFVNGMHVSPYEQGNIFNRDPLPVQPPADAQAGDPAALRRDEAQGYTLIPLSLYFKGSRVKVQIGLCRGKKLYDKREDAARQRHEAGGERALKERNM